MRKYIAKYKGLKYVIEENAPEVGFFIYVFDDQEKCIDDFPMENLEEAKAFALQMFGVPAEIWLKI